MMGGNVFAQKQNVFKINIFSPLVRTANFQFEHVLGEKKSGQLGFFYTGFKVSDTKFSGFGITPEFRFYPGDKRKAPAGFFVAPFLRYQSFNLKDQVNTDEATYSSFGGGLILGFQGLIGNVVSLEAFLGPSYNSGSLKVKSGNSSDFSLGSFDGFGLRAGVTLGIAF
jgi:hypothetical protein